MLWFVGENKTDFDGILNELSSSGYSFKWFVKISEAFNQLKQGLPEGIIIDADKSEISSIEFCYRVKSSTLYKKIALIILSGNSSESLEVSTFDAGADEFVVKPFREKAFLKRINARLHGNSPEVPISYRVDGKSTLYIDRDSFTVYLDQKLIPLSRKEFELLHLMASHPGKVFTREEIFNKVWKRIHDAKERTIDVHILRLRKKIGEDFISTQKGIGYRFCA